ncbi:3-oxoacyl-ACP reductase FabG [Paenibacillus larvae]|uniref:3-oxoacyl-[acyl-carrier-protein] reductase FabG n=3 Tax=Paenibacillus larvae TaxID=1464 RepID=A0A2L1UI74_9BACL|nr:3-oxoacyl-ACP reductase FabG [Paenibacillus larvae]AQT84443.1 3-ketoacyl-ACP reductase [Paenibacillus larvae subsp. pulvifaciens]AQZ46440.1 3-ketoacyl-ACP reductase [Paenibacillus larvae subsp. pulvifaciens]ARF67814.1 3-ketoacyl-ACP reductase [Paenibacillus larvae subsp. pulvifaciens]AVF20604.1 3-oxoacyl-[acyl-carrier-protein] reductase FabG [Paenibacillus larvae subsp. larvae]AVF28133.1 3-oxoacyl-[acyl-carrier-protein] reductase FabG [Paenibacillus larvae subsp. larvae]
MFNGNEVALVMGGSRGIGKAVTKDLARYGLTVYFTYQSNRHAAEEVAEEIGKEDGKGIAVQADLSDEQSIHDLFQQIHSQEKRIDIVVNNAGVTNDGFAAIMSKEKWSGVLDVNLTGTFLSCRQALKIMMRQRSGVILNVTSTSGIAGAKGQSNYSASKGGIISLTKTLALEAAEYGIRVNAVAPGYIKTDMTKSMNQQVLQQMLKFVPLGRMGEPEEVAYLTTFLCSNYASYITGKVYTIDGGLIHS